MILRVVPFISQIKMKQNKEYVDLFANSKLRREYYIARKFAFPFFENLIAEMLDKKMLNRSGDAINMFEPKCKDSFHFIFEGHSDLMLAVVRQFALICHLPNSDEKTGSNKTTLTILCPESYSIKDLEDLKGRLSKVDTGFLGNLMNYCETEIISKEDIVRSNQNSFIDIKVQIVAGQKMEQEEGTTFVITESMLSEMDITEEEMRIDISSAKNVNMIYMIGEAIDNHPPYDFANVNSYDFAIEVFRNKFSRKEIDDCWDNIGKLELKLSNVFCADCLKIKYQWICRQKKKDIKNYIDALARSEHSRWNVEKLILGYRPLDEMEKYKFGILIGNEKNCYRIERKNKKAHVDLCSYHELRRIHPHDMKYDYFLMLAAKYILN